MFAKDFFLRVDKTWDCVGKDQPDILEPDHIEKIFRQN